MSIRSFKDRLIKNANARDLDSSTIGGHLAKTFYWVDDKKDGVVEGSARSIDDSMFFSELYQALLDENCSYQTYLNDSIVSDTPADRHYPQKVSCLVKNISDDTSCFSEVAGSRLGNLLGVPTVFNVAVGKNPEINDTSDIYQYFENKFYTPTYDYLLSIDFVPWKHRTIGFDEMDIYINKYREFEEIEHKIDVKLPKLAKDFRFKIDEDSLRKFKEDFVRLYLFRNLLCGDQDFEEQNVITLIDGNGNIRLGPSFDMEFLFRENNSQHRINYATSDMEYLCKHYPHIVDGFMTKLNAVNESGQILEILEITKPSETSINLSRFF